MRYEIYDAFAGIKIIKGTREFLLLKTAITDISVVRGNIIKISTVNCSRNIYIPHDGVIIPEGIAISELIAQLNSWILENLNHAASG